MFNNPYLFEQAKKNMTADNLKMASERMANMSDEDLRNMTKMAGFNISPDLLKTSANMFKNMDDKELERMKNMSSSMNFPQNTGNFANTSSPFVNDEHPNIGKSKSMNENDKEETKIEIYPKIESLKRKGNEFFKNNQFEEASASYFEAILEVEEIKINEGKFNKEEIEKLETACRLNYATTKAKLGDYEIVLTQAKEVLKYTENGKAYFRVGQALHHLGKNEKALPNLENAVKMLPNDSIVIGYFDKVKTALSAKNKENSEPQPESSKETINEVQKEKEEKKTVEQDPIKKVIKKKNVQLESVDIKEEVSKPKPKIVPQNEEIPKSKDVIITEEPSKTTIPTSKVPIIDDDKLNKAKQSAEQLKNMNPDQMKMMTDYFKNMDNSFLKQIMKQQSGMDMSDTEIQNLKGMMTPEMLQMMSSMNMDSLPTNMTNAQSTSNPIQPNVQPNLSNLMQNKDLMNGMMDNLKKNPEMLKGMSKMLGENHPLSGMLEKSSPEDLQRMMNMMQTVMGFAGKVGTFISLIRKNYKLVIFLIIMMILYKFYL